MQKILFCIIASSLISFHTLQAQNAPNKSEKIHRYHNLSPFFQLDNLQLEDNSFTQPEVCLSFLKMFIPSQIRSKHFFKVVLNGNISETKTFTTINNNLTLSVLKFKFPYSIKAELRRYKPN